MKNNYTLVIGLEIHAQLQTKSKMFCADAVQFGAEPNTLTSPISLGHPGAMPVVNKKAVEFAIKMGLACGCKINEVNYFDRKNYFYPDLPKGYQTTQDKAPICLGGDVEIRSRNGEKKTVRLNRIHMEEDAGKLVHLEGNADSFVDLNRAGTPLIEIVTEPDLRSAGDASTFLMEIRKLVRYLEICDGNMEEGSFRCDANVSVMPIDSKEYGKKVEIKNMNSFRFVQKAIDFEFSRQCNLLENGEEILVVRCGFTDFGTMQKALEEKGITPISAEVEWVPSTTVPVTDEQAEDVSKLIERLEQDDDVQKVFHNMA